MARRPRRRRAKPIGAMAVVAIVVVAALLAARVLWSPAPPSDRPGHFLYYVLSLSWSPTYCQTQGRQRGEPQCEADKGHAFVLHGLWPQHDEGWPEFCATGEHAWVPEEVIAAMLDIMPSRSLIIHQYRKHGTCSGLDPEDYFAAARRAFETVRLPAPYRAPGRGLTVSPVEIQRDFAAANPHLGADAIAVACGRQRRLREVRVCLSRALAPMACGPNEDPRRLCAHESVVVPPVRSGR